MDAASALADATVYCEADRTKQRGLIPGGQRNNRNDEFFDTADVVAAKEFEAPAPGNRVLRWSDPITMRRVRHKAIG